MHILSLSTSDQALYLEQEIERYLNMFDRADPSDNHDDEDDGHTDQADLNKKHSALPLIEDALKVNIFTAKQKQKMLKWLDELSTE